MKISNSTVDILKNFSSINQSIMIETGNRLSTISVGRNVLGSSDCVETWPVDFGLYDVKEFLAAVELLEDPILDFNQSEKYVVIKSKKDANINLRYFYAASNIIVKPPKDMSAFPKAYEIVFELPWKKMQALINSSAVLQLSDVILRLGDDGNLILDVIDKKNDTTNKYSIPVKGKVSDSYSYKDFRFNFKIDNLKLIERDYTVSVSSQKVSKFNSVTDSVEYYIALEPDSQVGE